MARTDSRLTVWHGWGGLINPPNEDQYLCCGRVWLNDPICVQCGQRAMRVASARSPDSGQRAEAAEMLTRYLYDNGPTSASELSLMVSQVTGMLPRFVSNLADMMGLEILEGLWTLPAEHPWRQDTLVAHNRYNPLTDETEQGSMTNGILTSNWSYVYKEVGESIPSFLPVRISVGLPRFWSRAKTFPYLKTLAPVGLRKLSGPEFDEAYLGHLDKVGVEPIQAEFDRLAEEYQKPLVLLCFEKVDDEDDEFDRVCHRRTFAKWWYVRTDYLIREAQELNPRALRRQLQPR